MPDAFYSRPHKDRVPKARRVVENDQDVQLAESLAKESEVGPNNFTTLLRGTAAGVIKKSKVVRDVSATMAASSIPVEEDAWSVKQAINLLYPDGDDTQLTFTQYQELSNALYADRPDVTDLAKQPRAFGLGPAGTTTRSTSSRRNAVGEHLEHLTLLLGAWQLLQVVAAPDNLKEDLQKEPRGASVQDIVARVAVGMKLLDKLNRGAPGGNFQKLVEDVSKGRASEEQTEFLQDLMGKAILDAQNNVTVPDDLPPDALTLTDRAKRIVEYRSEEEMRLKRRLVVKYAHQYALENGDQPHLAWITWYRAKEAEGRLDPLTSYNVTDNDELGDELRQEEQDCVHTTNVEATNALIDDLAAILYSNSTKSGICCMIAVLSAAHSGSTKLTRDVTGHLLGTITTMRDALRVAIALARLEAYAAYGIASLFDTEDFLNHARHLAVRRLALFMRQSIRTLASELKSLLTQQPETIQRIFKQCPPLSNLIQRLTAFLSDMARSYLSQLEKEMDRIYNRTDADQKFNAHLADLWQMTYWDRTLTNLVDILKAAKECVPGDEPSSQDLFNQVLNSVPPSAAETANPAIEAVGSRFTSFSSTSGVRTPSGVQIPSVLVAREQARLENEAQIVGECLTEHGSLGADLLKATQTTIERVRDDRIRERIRKQQEIRRRPSR